MMEDLLDFDFELALERAEWAAGTGYTAWMYSGGNPVAAVIGVGVGGLVPDIIEYWDGEPAPANLQAQMQEWEGWSSQVVDEVGDAQGLTPAQKEEAQRALTELIYNYSFGLSEMVGVVPDTTFSEYFASMASSLVNAGTPYADFFRDLYNRALASTKLTQQEIDATNAVQLGTTPEGGLWRPKKPVPAPAPAPMPTKTPWAMWIVIIALIALVAAVIMKMRKKKKRR